MMSETKQTTYVTYIIKPIVKGSLIFGLFYIHKIDDEVILECMEIIGREYKVLKYIRRNFL